MALGDDVDAQFSIDATVNGEPTTPVQEGDLDAQRDALRRRDAAQFRAGSGFSAPAGAPDEAAYEAWRLSQSHVSYPPPPQPAGSVPQEESPTQASGPRYGDYAAAIQMRQDILTDARNQYTASGRFPETFSPQFGAMVQEAWQSVGVGEPQKEQSPYQEARARAADVVADLRDTYTVQGRYGDIGSKQYRADEARTLFQEGYGPEPQEEAPRPYQAAMQAKSAIEADLRDEYVGAGRLSDIGGKEFHGVLQDRLVEGGWIEGSAPEEEKRGLARMGQNLREGGTSLAFGLGYSAMSIGSGLARQAEMNDGRYVSPEQQTAAQVNTFAPAAGGILGTVIGEAVAGPAGGLAGQFIGGAVGEGVSATVGASQEREQKTREEAERLSAALGSAAGTVEQFKGQLEATGAPIQQLSSALQGVAGLGNLGPNSVAGTGALVNAFGVNSEADFAAIGKYTSSPLLHGIGSDFAAGTGGAADINALAADAASRGDFSSLRTFQQAAGDARAKDDSNFQAAARHVEDVKKEGFGLGSIAVGFAQFARSHGNWLHNDITDALDTEDTIRTGAGIVQGADTRAQNALAEQMVTLQSTEMVASSGVQVAGSGVSLAEARGGSAADVSVQSGAYRTSLSAAKAASDAEANALTAELSTPAGVKIADDLRVRIADARAKSAGYDVAEAQSVRSDFDRGFQEEGSGYSLNVLRAQIEGKSPEQVAALQRSQADYLAGVQGPISPAERNQLQGEAAQLRYTAKIDTYEQQEANIGLGVAGAQASVQTAQSNGTPQQVQQAQAGLLQQLISLEQQYKSEAEGTNQAWDRRLQKQQQSVTLAGQINSLQDQERQQLAAGVASIDDANQGTARAGLSRAVAIGGSGAYAAFAGEDASDISNAQSALQAALKASGGKDTIEVVNDRRRVAELTNRQAEDNQQGQALRLTVGERTQDERLRTDFEVSKLAPFQGGPESNPFTRGTELMAEDSRLAVRYGAAARAATDPLAREADQQQADRYRIEAAGLERERYTAQLGALPEMVLNSVGDGYGSALVAPSALSAAFSPGPLSGSWGGTRAAAVMPAGNADYASGTGTPGGAAGGFNEMVNELRQIRQLLAGAKVPHTSPPAYHAPSAVRAQAQALNPYSGK